MCEPQKIGRLAFYGPQCWAHPMAPSGFMHELNCGLTPQHLLLCKPWCWSSKPTPRAVSRMEVFLCPHRCKEEPPRPRAMQKEATVVPRGHDHPPIILTPARGTPRAHLYSHLFTSYPLWSDVTARENFTFRSMTQNTGKSQRGFDKVK